MPLVNLRSLIEEAEANKYSLAGFNILNLEMIEGVVEAAQTLGVSVILNVHPDKIINTSLTDPVQAERFIRETGVDILSPDRSCVD